MADTSQTNAEPEMLTFTVADEDAGTRLDAFLASQIEGTSRSSLKRLIEEGDVRVGDADSKPSYRLRTGDVIEVELAPPPPSEFHPEDIPLDIVFEDDSLIVVNKPAGMVVHPAAGVRGGTLANAIAFHLGKHGGALEGIRTGIVHRLDRDTSGLLVVAKTIESHEHLSEQFRARTIHKSYVALVHGQMKEAKGRIEEPLARDPRNRIRMAVVRGGREALTLWRVRQVYDRFSLLDVEIKTGRTHQIRVHLAWIKHPVVGDDVYGGGRDNMIADSRLRSAVNTLARQFLHAERLGFKHPTSAEWMSFRQQPPDELMALLTQLD